MVQERREEEPSQEETAGGWVGAGWRREAVFTPFYYSLITATCRLRFWKKEVVDVKVSKRKPHPKWSREASREALTLHGSMSITDPKKDRQ